MCVSKGLAISFKLRSDGTVNRPRCQFVAGEGVSCPLHSFYSLAISLVHCLLV